MSVALLFPGQGSQEPGMLRALPEHREVARTLDEARSALGEDVFELDDEDRLGSTEAAQVGLLVCGVASARLLLAEAGSEAGVGYVAGHSVGAFAAAVVCGALGFADALGVVRLRGRLMAEAFPEGYGMVAIEGLTERTVEALAADARAEGREVYLANINSRTQTVLAGEDGALERAAAGALEAGARRTERLDVAVPSHCPLLSGVSGELARALDAVAVEDPGAVYVTNRSARAVRDAARVREDLAKGVMSPVRWDDATSLISELGCPLFVEVLPGHVLGRLAAQSPGMPRAVSLADVGVRSAAVRVRRASEGRGGDAGRG